MNSPRETGGAPGVPPPQHNLRTATDRALESVRGQSAQQLQWLGAELFGRVWRLPVLGSSFDVDIQAREVCTGDGVVISPSWRILALHYLGIRSRPARMPPEITFADLPSGRTYANVYQQRVIRRLCETVGRDAGTLRAAAHALGARDANLGDLAFDFTVFPRLPVRLIWYAGDEELPPSGTLLLPGNIESLLCVEDIVVVSERLISRLDGRAF
jgi:hypothetical protein